MAFTALMFVVLIASYALMFGFVQFTENVIVRPTDSAADGGFASANDVEPRTN